MYKVILFYKYTRIKDPAKEMLRQKSAAEVLGMRGRMIVAEEGVNGTFEGTLDAVTKYMEWMKADPRFSDIHWKVSNGTEDGTAFPKLSVKVRKEIVSLHLGDPSTSLGTSERDIDPNKITGKHLKPKDLRSWYEEGKEFYIVDMRNDYELESGKFEKTIFPGMENFRDLREKVGEIVHLKDKTVLTVCTGGVRCEKASGLLVREGFSDVHQLDGGIVSYMEQYPGQDFKGSLYVFDKRLTMHFEDPENHTIIGTCKLCGTTSERYVNCANLGCHLHFICCNTCSPKNEDAFCSESCAQVGK